MNKALLVILFLSAAFSLVVAAKPVITFNPFKIHFQSPLIAIGLLVMDVGLLLTIHGFRREAKADAYLDGYSKGCSDIGDHVREEIRAGRLRRE